MKREQGFTLIELLCALTILALVLGTCLRIMQGGTRATAASRDYGRALAVAEAHLTQLRAAPTIAAIAANGQEGGIKWFDRVSRSNDIKGLDAGKWAAWRLESRAEWGDGRIVALTSLRLEAIP